MGEHIGIGLTSNVYLAHCPNKLPHAVKVYDFNHNQHHSNGNSNGGGNINSNGGSNGGSSSSNVIDRNSRLFYQY